MIIFSISAFFTDTTIEVGNNLICNSWYSVDLQICMVLKDSGYSIISAEDRIKYKIKEDKLILYLVYDPRSLIDRKTKYTYKIHKLTNDTLIISGIKGKSNLEELQVTYKPVIFVASTPNCFGNPLR